MKQYKNRRIIISLYAAAASMVILTGFTSLAAEKDTKAGLPDIAKEESAEWNVSGIAGFTMACNRIIRACGLGLGAWSNPGAADSHFGAAVAG